MTIEERLVDNPALVTTLEAVRCRRGDQQALVGDLEAEIERQCTRPQRKPL